MPDAERGRIGMPKGFFIGNELDSATRKPRGRLELDPTDLLTHGLIVGMTGSGKTGLAIVIIEEALRQGVPVLAIDPRGDLPILLWLFDRLDPAQFAAWVDPEAARRQGQTPEQAGAEAAAQWTKGLASWGLTAADVADLRARHEAVIYTPGSRAGVPLGMLQSLEAPKGSFDAQEEDLRDEIAGIVAGLLGLDKVKTWMRRQGGTTQLRALVYMDEIYGYFPPHPANPPTKRPLLTLLKQARAQGVGVVLATQNPVDLDYKGLANIGVWLVGKLQTAQDRDRLRDGLTGAGMAAAAVDALLDATGKRVFLLHDVHRPAPVLVESRWAMSYLRGPLTREEIGRLMADRVRATPAAPPRASDAPAAPVARWPAAAAPGAPAGLAQSFLKHFGAEGADPYLLVKYAVRYKGMEETVGLRAWPLDAASAAEVFDGDDLPVDEAVLAQAPP